jgi:ribosomal protein S18 acetylase RimI-like enzyme
VLEIRVADDMAVVRALFIEYAAWTGLDLSFQNFDEELASLPADYDPIFVAMVDGKAAGCVALRRIDDEICEMKRLFVRPHARGVKAGRALVLRVIDEARRRGFNRMRLDTLPTMTSAIRLYERLGFRNIEPYRHNPIPGSRFLELDLASFLQDD